MWDRLTPGLTVSSLRFQLFILPTLLDQQLLSLDLKVLYFARTNETWDPFTLPYLS